MRKLIVGLVIGFFAVLMPALAVSEESAFRLKDGYFQITHSQPNHLICKPIEKQHLCLEDKFRLWLSWEIEKGKESPCSRRSDNSCYFKLEILGKDLDGKETVWILYEGKSFKIDKDCFHFSISVPGYIPNKAAFGDAEIRIRITDEKGAKNFYSYEIPIGIR